MIETVLVIEDEPSILKGLELNLRIEGYRVLSARDGEEGLRMFQATPPDFVVLDIMLPAMDGFRVIRELRARDPELPILVLSAKVQEADKVLGLSLGADDYMTKPFGLAELLARIRAGLRRKRRHAVESCVAFGEVVVELDARRVTLADKEVELTAREFDVLRYFVSRPNAVFTREQLMHTVWGMDHHGTLRTVDNFVARLRAKFEADPERPRFFLTVRGIGYRFDSGG